MKVIALADLHYNIPRCREPVREQAAAVARDGGDVLVLAGDTASVNLEFFEEALGLFDGLAGPKLLVPGNHDIWVAPGQDSRRRYEQVLPEICRRHGFTYLDAGPVLVDGTAFVGTMGWYDYSFRDERLGVPMRFYEAKVGPGAAEALRKYQHLVNGHGDVTDEMKGITAVWRDGAHVRLGMSDAAFAVQQADSLREQLAWASRRAEQIVAVVHHLPIRRMAPHMEHPNWLFAQAFLGSTMLGEALEGQPKLRYVLAGHSHHPWRGYSNGQGALVDAPAADPWPPAGAEYINIGSGYHRKHTVRLDL